MKDKNKVAILSRRGPCKPPDAPAFKYRGACTAVMKRKGSIPYCWSQAEKLGDEYGDARSQVLDIGARFDSNSLRGLRESKVGTIC